MKLKRQLTLSSAIPLGIGINYGLWCSIPPLSHLFNQWPKYWLYLDFGLSALLSSTHDFY